MVVAPLFFFLGQEKKHLGLVWTQLSCAATQRSKIRRFHKYLQDCVTVSLTFEL